MAERSLTLSRPRRRKGTWSVQSALAPLRGFPSPSRCRSNLRRPGWVQGATDGSHLPTVSTTVKLGANVTNSNTNTPNKDHPVPLRATQGHTKYHQKASIFDLHTPRTRAAGAGSIPSEITAANANVGSAGQFWSRQRGGRQGRALGAPLRGRRALTALHRRETGLPCCRGPLSITRRDVSDLASQVQSASTCLCKMLQSASNRFKIADANQCNFVQKSASECCEMFRFVACTPVHPA